jgi:hypothetical protein
MEINTSNKNTQSRFSSKSAPHYFKSRLVDLWLAVQHDINSCTSNKVFMNNLPLQFTSPIYGLMQLWLLLNQRLKSVALGIG